MYWVSRYTKYKIFDYIFVVLFISTIIRVITIIYTISKNFETVKVLLQFAFELSLYSTFYLILFSALTDLDEKKKNFITFLISLIYPVTGITKLFSSELVLLLRIASIVFLVAYFVYFFAKSSTYELKRRFQIAITYGPKSWALFVVTFIGLIFYMAARAFGYYIASIGGFGYLAYFAARDSIIYIFLTYIMIILMIPYDYPYKTVIKYFKASYLLYLAYIITAMVYSTLIYQETIVKYIPLIIMTIILTILAYSNIWVLRKKIFRGGYKFF